MANNFPDAPLETVSTTLVVRSLPSGHDQAPTFLAIAIIKLMFLCHIWILQYVCMLYNAYCSLYFSHDVPGTYCNAVPVHRAVRISKCTYENSKLDTQNTTSTHTVPAQFLRLLYVLLRRHEYRHMHPLYAYALVHSSSRTCDIVTQKLVFRSISISKGSKSEQAE